MLFKFNAKNKAREIDQAGWGRTFGAGVVSLIYFFPVLFIIITAFKEHTDALSVPVKLFPDFLGFMVPEYLTFEPTFENFVNVFSRSFSAGAAVQDTGFDRFFFNSVFIAGFSVLLALFIGTLAAFGFSRYPLKGNDTYLFTRGDGRDILRDAANSTADQLIIVARTGGDQFDESGLSLFIVDANAAGLERIRDGEQLFAIDQQPWLQGFLAVSLADSYVNYGMAMATTPLLTGPGIVDAANVEATLTGAEQGYR